MVERRWRSWACRVWRWAREERRCCSWEVSEVEVVGAEGGVVVGGGWGLGAEGEDMLVVVVVVCGVWCVGLRLRRIDI